MSGTKLARRHSFSSLEEVAREFEGATDHAASVDSPGKKEEASSRKRPHSPSASEGCSPKRSGGVMSTTSPSPQKSTESRETTEGIVCLPQGVLNRTK